MHTPMSPTATPCTTPVLDDETYRLVQELFHIVRTGETARVTRLLEMGLPPNLRDGKGDSLLMLAAYHGHTDLVDSLLRHGADCELSNDRGQTPLAAAVFKGYIDIVKLLLAGGAEVDARMPGGKTALMLAAGFDRAEILDLLLSFDADPTLRDEQGMTAQRGAEMMGATTTAQRLQVIAAVKDA